MSQVCQKFASDCRVKYPPANLKIEPSQTELAFDALLKLLADYAFAKA